MEKLVYKNFFAVIFIVLFFIFTNDLGGQRPPREVRGDARERERKTEEGRSSVDKKEKWSEKSSKDSFKDAAERKMVERDPPSRGGKNVPKAQKWSRGDLKKKFNEENPDKKGDGDKDGGKKGDTGVPPVPAPPIKPKWKPPGM